MRLTSCYGVERQLNSLSEQLPVHEKARIENLLNDLRVQLKEKGAADRVRSLKEELEQAAHAFENLARSSSGPQSSAGKDHDVVDAEFDEA